jgi:enoyl-[acyl-carrier protein] reductase I
VPLPYLTRAARLGRVRRSGMARLAAPLMTDGGAMFAMSYTGAHKVVPNYNVMGPVKAALEAACRYLA